MHDAVRPPSAGRLIITLWDVLIFGALLLLALAWLCDPLKGQIGPARLTIHCDWKPLVFPLALAAARPWIRRRTAPQCAGLLGRPLAQKITLAVVALFIMMAGFEGILALVGFKANLPPILFKDQDAHGGRIVVNTLPDPELLWRLEPGSMFQGQRVNRLGFRDREVNPVKAPGTERVLCLGCSVTGQGLPGYPQYLHAGLQAAPPTPEHWEALNLGVHGYSALQGLRLFQRMAPQLAPDVVTVYFGWNDHWLSDLPDCSRMARTMDAWSGHLFQVVKKKRCLQFLALAWDPALRGTRAPRGRVYRVPPDDYRATLVELVQAIRAAGAVPVLITAPRRHLEEGLIARSYATSVAQAEQAHDQYVEITREVARAQQAVLLDLAAQFAGRECDGYFAPDGIHMDLYPKESALHQVVPPGWQPGLSHIAAALQRTLQDVVRSPEWQARTHPAGGVR